MDRAQHAAAHVRLATPGRGTCRFRPARLTGPMLPQIEGLLVVQDRDRQLRDLRAQLEQIPAEETRAKARLHDARKAVEDAKARLRDNEVETHKVELDVETRRNTIVRLKNQQFETRKNEEFRAIGHEIERYEAEIDALETRELGFMEGADSLREEVGAAQAELAKLEAVVLQDLESLQQRAAQVRQREAEVATERDRLASGVDPDLLKLYDRLMKTKNGLAVASLEGGQCGGCHVRVVPATLIKVQAGKDIAQCENCGRILYIV